MLKSDNPISKTEVVLAEISLFVMLVSGVSLMALSYFGSVF